MNMEIVHYFDSNRNIRIYSYGSMFVVEIDGVTSMTKVKLPFVKMLLMHFRLLRRLLRLNTSNCYPLFNQNGILESIVIIYQFGVYLWDLKQLVKTFALSDCRNVMHQSIAESEKGYLYFGEYGANKKRGKVSVYRSTDRAVSWHEIYRFKPGSIKHIHAVQWDVYEKKIWLCTGDEDGECQIVVADLDFNHIEVLGDGTQKWRTCHIIFEKDYVVWGMDTPQTDCYMVKMHRKTREIEMLSRVAGPVWYGKKWSADRYLVSTSVEPGIKHLDKKSKVYVSNDLHHWEELWSFDKDRYSPIYFKFGSIGFSNGGEGNDEFYLHFEAIKGFDGKSILIKGDAKF